MTNRSSFDYTAALAAVCSDMCFRVPELRHIDMTRVAVGFSQTKNSEPFGIFASATPLRFENGEPFRQSRGRIWTVQRHFRSDGVEYLYILYFYVPRFIELSLSQKLETIVHELYHVNPLFNGDLRRFSGRRFAHGSKKRYDQIVSNLVQYWLKQDPPNDLWEFLCYNYRDLAAKYGKLSGMRIPAPKVVPVKYPLPKDPEKINTEKYPKFAIFGLQIPPFHGTMEVGAGCAECSEGEDVPLPVEREQKTERGE